jgi:long-chain acyl-CoA synthetase
VSSPNVTSSTLTTLCEQFRAQVTSHPARIAVHARGVSASYEQIGRWAGAFSAAMLDAGLSRGDRVVLLLTNSAEYVACYLGVLEAGGIVVPLNPESTRHELGAAFSNCEPFAAVVGSKAAREFLGVKDAGSIPAHVFIHDWTDAARGACPGAIDLDGVLARDDEAASAVRVALDDVAQIIYTSGTTGRPKGVTLTHRNIAANCASIVRYLSLTRDDSVLASLPFYYSYGNSLLFTHLAVGGSLVIPADSVFWNRTLDLMEQQRVTGFAGVPSTFAMLLHKSNFAKRELPHLRYVTCAGGGLARPVAEQIRAAVPHAKLFLMYGQTEATARLSTLLPEDLDKKPGSIGRGIPGVELRVLDEHGQSVAPGVEGEIVARGANIMRGYWNDSESTADVLRPDGLHTGDLATVDEDGYLFIVGRRNDLIKSGAYRIHPAEIEEALLAHPGVAEVAVVGLPDPIWSESPVAFVVPAPGQPVPTSSELIEHCRARLPRHKLIREARLVDALPKTSSGKIQRAELRKSAAPAS